MKRMDLSNDEQGLLRYALRMAHEHTTNVPIRGELAEMYERIAGQPLAEPIRLLGTPLSMVDANEAPDDDDIETYGGTFTYGFRRGLRGAP